MSEKAVSSPGTSQPSTATMPRDRIRPSVRRLLSMLGLAAALVLTMWLTLDKSSPIYALITPPHTPDFTASGELPLQQFGFSVESAGDINDDGFGDVIVGAAADNAIFGNKIFIYKGSATGLTTTIFYSDTGQVGENLGWSVGGGGDVNNDGVDDFIAGTYINGAGSAYIYHGSGIALPTQAVTLSGENGGDQFGWSVAFIGDVNNDNITDVAVGAPTYSNTGRVYIYYGPVVGPTDTPDTMLDGEDSLERFGFSISGAGDVNGDGIDDMVVGAWGNSDGGSDAGKAYIFYGSGTGISQGNNDTVIGDSDDKLGTSVQGAGDVNGDGFADVIIGADTYNAGAPAPGYFSVYPGGPSGLIPTPLFTRQGESNNDHFGFAVTGNGDVDGDGFSDFAVGAHEFDASIILTDTGKAYGYVACTDGAIVPSLLFSDTGELPFDYYGRSLAIVNDVNGDETDDLVVGAYAGENNLAVTTGKIYAYYGVAGGCRPAVELTKTVGLANFPNLYTNTAVITVPTNATVLYNYIVENTGNVTLTQHAVVDDKLGDVTTTAYTLTPGANVSVNITNIPGISVTPGVSITNVATWTAAISITSPSGVTTPTNKTLFAQGIASAKVNISGPTTDQDGDAIPDNVEQSGNPDGDALPNYLDIDSDNDSFADAVEAGPDPTNPIDKDGNGIPAYLDPNENPNTSVDQEIQGLTVNGPDKLLAGQTANFNATITAGTNVSYTWTFGDSGTGVGQTTSHVYTATGTYLVVVTASNSLGQAQAQKFIIIQVGTRLPRIMTVGTGGG